ncbi:MAG: hypothetical protein ACYSWO_04405 [Planctomycetota bacterium]
MVVRGVAATALLQSLPRQMQLRLIPLPRSRGNRFLSALIFLRRAKRKLVLQVEPVALAAHGRAERAKRIIAVDSRGESFGQMAGLGQPGGQSGHLGPRTILLGCLESLMHLRISQISRLRFAWLQITTGGLQSAMLMPKIRAKMNMTGTFA